MKSMYRFSVWSMDKEGSAWNQLKIWHSYTFSMLNGKFILQSHEEGHVNYDRLSGAQRKLFKLIEDRFYSHRMIALARKRPL